MNTPPFDLTQHLLETASLMNRVQAQALAGVPVSPIETAPAELTPAEKAALPYGEVRVAVDDALIKAMETACVEVGVRHGYNVELESLTLQMRMLRESQRRARGVR